MQENSELTAYYIIKENDNSGKTAHGPYMMEDAELRVGLDEKLISQSELVSLRQNAASFEGIEGTPNQGPSPVEEKMLREIRSWAFFLIVIGIIQIVAAGWLSNTWGLMLIIVGLASFYFRSPAMFVIYGTTLAWAGLSNALTGLGTWVIFSLLQAYFTFQTFRQFFQYRSIIFSGQALEKFSQPKSPTTEDKAANTFPWISLLSGLASFVGLASVFIGGIFMAMTDGLQVSPFINFIEGFVINFAVIGIAAGLASILLKYRYPVVSIIGIFSGILVLIVEVGLFLLF